MARRERARRFAAALAELAAIVLVLAVVGIALGLVASQLSDAEETATPVAGGRTTTSPATATTPTARMSATSAAVSPIVYLRLKVLDARLFTDAAPSGAQPQPARMTVRIRAVNPASERVMVDPPVLVVGSLRIPTDPDAAPAGSQFDPLAAGARQTVTLRFVLTGAATPKVVRDRRARLLIAGQSLVMRVNVRAATS